MMVEAAATRLLCYRSLTEPGFKLFTIETWDDYIEANKANKPIRNHLTLSGSAYYPIAMNRKLHCIHQSCNSIEDCVNRLIQTMLNPDYAFSEMSLTKRFFHIDPAGKKLCNHCILLFCAKTNNFCDIINHFYKSCCHSKVNIFKNSCIYYFTRIFLSHPLVIKYILNYTDNVTLIYKMIKFY
eukprot:106370_1